MVAAIALVTFHPAFYSSTSSHRKHKREHRTRLFGAKKKKEAKRTQVLCGCIGQTHNKKSAKGFVCFPNLFPETHITSHYLYKKQNKKITGIHIKQTRMIQTYSASHICTLSQKERQTERHPRHDHSHLHLLRLPPFLLLASLDDATLTLSAESLTVDWLRPRSPPKTPRLP